MAIWNCQGALRIAHERDLALRTNRKRLCTLQRKIPILFHLSHDGRVVMVYGQQARHRDGVHQATPSLKRVLDIHS